MSESVLLVSNPESPTLPEQQCQHKYILNVSRFSQMEPIKTHFKNLFKLVMLAQSPTYAPQWSWWGQETLSISACSMHAHTHVSSSDPFQSNMPFTQCRHTSTTSSSFFYSPGDSRLDLNGLDTDVWLVIYFWEEAHKLSLMKRL